MNSTQTREPRIKLWAWQSGKSATSKIEPVHFAQVETRRKATMKRRVARP